MNKIIVTTYKLEALNSEGQVVTTEEATAEQPFKFISGMGFALDAFEERVEPLSEGEEFDFVLEPDEAYGAYDESHVIDFPKDVFCVDGRFDGAQIHPGANVPLVNEDGQRFVGHVLEVSDDKVRVDLNDTLSGHRIHFVGKVIISRPATNKEIEAFANMLAGEECGCGCGCDHGGDHDHCHQHDHQHEHEHGGGHCCGGHQHKDGGHQHKDGGHCCHNHHH